MNLIRKALEALSGSLGVTCEAATLFRTTSFRTWGEGERGRSDDFVMAH
jgi:hypothetical protein